MDYECTIIVGDNDYSALSKKEQKATYNPHTASKKSMNKTILNLEIF